MGGVVTNLLGEDFISHFECNFDHITKEFLIQKGGLKVLNEPKKPVLNPRVVTTKDCILSPNQEMLVRVKFKHRPLNGNGVIVSDPRCVQKHDLMVARTVYNTKQQNFSARILNTSKNERTTSCGTFITHFERVRNIETSDKASEYQPTDKLKRSIGIRLKHRPCFCGSQVILRFI